MSFVIQRFVWDIDYPLREKAFALQGRCSRLFTAAAVPILEDVFASRVPLGRDFRFDTLSLDLGVIDAALLERDFPERFREALVRALFERMGPVDAPASAAAAVFPVRPLETLEHFLLEGALPWWASQQAADAPQALLERLCAELPGQLRPLLLQAGQLARVRRRLAYQFPDPALRATVELIVPGEGIFIGGYHQTLVRVQQETRWAYGETAGFAREVWLLILTFLLRDMAGQFNRRAFVRQTLGEMAAHYNVSYVELLSVFAEGLRLT
ncbi:MAG TPA: contractile injection system tape measure protein, partial [Dinghuibacter sp.]|uniref:contractile injection system tape measure protein n=1 Tax=Dinghuibacter sp. TaxID=2024697 RepID=UPI002C90D5D5